jgi:hypothetical protein
MIMASTKRDLIYALIGVFCGLLAICFGVLSIKKTDQPKDNDKGGNKAESTELSPSQSQSKNEVKTQVNPEPQPETKSHPSTSSQRPGRNSIFQILLGSILGVDNQKN